MNIQDTAKNVGVSPEELMEILQDIDIAVDGLDADLNSEQLSAICDELGYASMEEARADNISEEPSVEEVPASGEPEAAPEAAPVEEAAPAEAAETEESAAHLIELKKPKIVVKEFAERMGMKPNLVIAELMKMNVFASINAEIDLKIAKEIGNVNEAVSVEAPADAEDLGPMIDPFVQIYLGGGFEADFPIEAEVSQ